MRTEIVRGRDTEWHKTQEPTRACFTLLARVFERRPLRICEPSLNIAFETMVVRVSVGEASAVQILFVYPDQLFLKATFETQNSTKSKNAGSVHGGQLLLSVGRPLALPG